MDNANPTIPTMPPAPPADAHPRLHALHAHFSAIWHKVVEVAHTVVDGFEHAAEFVKKEAPIVEAGAAAVSVAVPVVGPVAKVVEEVAAGAVAGVSSLADLLQKVENPPAK